MSEGPVRPRFTLRELFVVVTGICVLMALLVPAIQSAREAARRQQCGNNLKQFGIALENYHLTYNVFPAGAMHAGLNPGGDPPLQARLGPSWWYVMLPFLEQGNIYDRIRATQYPGGPSRNRFCGQDMIAAGVARLSKSGAIIGPFGTYLDHLRCPSSPLPVTETPTGPICLPTYAGIAGGCDIDPNSQDYGLVRGTAAGLTALETGRVYHSTQKGVVVLKTGKTYHNTHKGTGTAAGGIVTSSGMLPPCQHVRLADCIDGTSNVLIVAEQSDWLLDRNPTSSRNYHGDPGWTVGGTGPGGGWLSGTRRVDPVPKIDKPGGPPAPWGADCWNIATVRYPPNFKRVMGSTPLPGCSENHGINNPLQSPHPRGLQVGMVDGSVQFISESLNFVIFLRMAIRDDGGLFGVPD
jgi:hypothetical protein